MTPVTNPVLSMVATDVLSLFQMPPVAASLKVMVAAWQTTGVPVMVPAAGSGLTVITVMATAVP